MARRVPVRVSRPPTLRTVDLGVDLAQRGRRWSVRRRSRRRRMLYVLDYNARTPSCLARGRGARASPPASRMRRSRIDPLFADLAYVIASRSARELRPLRGLSRTGLQQRLDDTARSAGSRAPARLPGYLYLNAAACARCARIDRKTRRPSVYRPPTMTPPGRQFTDLDRPALLTAAPGDLASQCPGPASPTTRSCTPTWRRYPLLPGRGPVVPSVPRYDLVDDQTRTRRWARSTSWWSSRGVMAARGRRLRPCQRGGRHGRRRTLPSVRLGGRPGNGELLPAPTSATGARAAPCRPARLRRRGQRLPLAITGSRSPPSARGHARRTEAERRPG